MGTAKKPMNKQILSEALKQIICFLIKANGKTTVKCRDAEKKNTDKYR